VPLCAVGPRQQQAEIRRSRASSLAMKRSGAKHDNSTATARLVNTPSYEDVRRRKNLCAMYARLHFRKVLHHCGSRLFQVGPTPLVGYVVTGQSVDLHNSANVYTTRPLLSLLSFCTRSSSLELTHARSAKAPLTLHRTAPAGHLSNTWTLNQNVPVRGHKKDHKHSHRSRLV
jgi:hypothetical protein